ncbi:cation:proton antiporter [Pseudomonas sp. zfem001]|nr:cation:proton antiporter [Pseudomonas sp. zfem001]MDU9409880.1 cation:proton antiporter [Pseudomonas sp. zfem001]
MQLLYTILTMLLVVSGTRITAQFIPLPLPLLQILIGALLAIPVLGLHVRLDPELFLLLFIPPLLFVDGWRMPKGQFRQLRTPILLQLPQDNAALRERELNRHRALMLESAIRYLESEDERAADAEGAITSVEVKARLMSEYRDLLERAHDGDEAREQQREVDRLEYRLRLQALRTQRLELYRMRKDNELDDDMLTEILRDLDIAEARLHKS